MGHAQIDTNGTTTTSHGMPMVVCDVLVIGSGPAGLAAAYQARRSGAENVIILERNAEPGGILTQCIHNGFGVEVFGEDLTGPEYATRWIERAQESNVDIRLNTMVLSIEDGPRVVASNESEGLVVFEPKALVLAMGCRERPRGALAIPGTRPAGVYTAGTAQRLVNIEGYMPGKRFVILGSGDIGMIMARRLTLEGATVVAMVEILPYISGLRRNLVQCVRDYDIPLYLSTTVTDIKGLDRVESVVISQVDERWRPIEGTQQELSCDALLLSVGLIPENELSRMAGVALDPITGGPIVDAHFATNVPGVFAAGNVVQVYDRVDDVSESALRAGHCAAQYAASGQIPKVTLLSFVPGDNVRYVVPQQMSLSCADDALDQGDVRIEFRVRAPIERAVRAEVLAGDRVLVSKRFRYVRPSEMVVIDLPQSALDELDGRRSLTVAIKS